MRRIELGCRPVSHRHLEITDDEWGAFMDDLAQTLDKFQVPEAERQDLTTIVEGTKEEIVIAPLRGPAT